MNDCLFYYIRYFKELFYREYEKVNLHFYGVPVQASHFSLHSNNGPHFDLFHRQSLLTTLLMQSTTNPHVIHIKTPLTIYIMLIGMAVNLHHRVGFLAAAVADRP